MSDRERYDELCARPPLERARALQHRADVCDKHPRDKLAMVWERFDGARRELSWGELQDLANQAAHVLREHGVERGDRVAVVLPPTPETAAVFFGTWKLGAILLSMSVLYGDDGDPPPPRRLAGRGCSSPTRPTPSASRARAGRRALLVLDDATAARRRADRARVVRHRRRRPGAALLHLGHDRAGQGHRARPPLPARPRGVRLLPRGAGRRALPRHGRVGVGGGHRAAARAVAAGRGAVRLPARGRLRPARAARLPLPPRGHQRLHDADRDALDDGDRGRRHALPAAVPPRLLAPASR